MTTRRTVARSSVHLLTVRGVRVAVQFAVMALTANVFGAEDAGEFALALAMTAPVFVILDLGLRTLYLSRIPHPPYQQLLHIRLAATLFALLVSATLMLARPDMAPVLAAVALAKSADLFMELSIGPLQLTDRLSYSTVLSLATGVMVLTVYVASVPGGFHQSLGTALAIGAVALTVGSLALGAGAARAAEGFERRSRTSGLFRDGIALGFGNGIVSLSSSVPQIVLATAYGTVLSGRYAVILYVVLAGEMLLNAVSQSALPLVVQRRSLDGSEGLPSWADRWTYRGTLAALPVAAAAVIVAALVIPVAMGEIYRLTTVEMILLAMILTLLPALFVGSVMLQALNHYRATATIGIFTLGAVIVTALALSPKFGVAGALAATLSGTVVRIGLARAIWVRASATSISGAAAAWPSR